MGHRHCCRPEREPEARHHLAQIVGQSCSWMLCRGKGARKAVPRRCLWLGSSGEASRVKTTWGHNLDASAGGL